MVVDVKLPTDDEGGAVQAAAGERVSPRDLDISPPSALFERNENVHPQIELTPDGEGFLALSLGDHGPGGEPTDEIIVTLNFSKVLEGLGSDGR